MIEFEGNKKTGFHLVVTAKDEAELHRSGPYKRKKDASRHLGRLRAQLTEAPLAVQSATRSVGGQRERDKLGGTPIGDALDKHSASHEVIRVGELLSALHVGMGMGMEFLAEAPATDLVVAGRKALDQAATNLEEAIAEFKQLLDKHQGEE